MRTILLSRVMKHMIKLCRYACIDDNIGIEEMWDAAREETCHYNIIISYFR